MAKGCLFISYMFLFLFKIHRKIQNIEQTYSSCRDKREIYSKSGIIYKNKNMIFAIKVLHAGCAQSTLNGYCCIDNIREAKSLSNIRMKLPTSAKWEELPETQEWLCFLTQ